MQPPSPTVYKTHSARQTPLGAQNMRHTEITLETSDEHDTKDATEMEDTHNTASHDRTDSMRAVLDTVS